MITASTTITVVGPAVDGTAKRILAAGMDEAARKLADDAQSEVEQQTGQFRNPTGRFRSLLHVEVAAPFYRVLPGMLPYVHWLEGTSRRNETTRFKGYHLFARARTRFESYAQARFEQYLQPALRRIGVT